MKRERKRKGITALVILLFALSAYCDGYAAETLIPKMIRVTTAPYQITQYSRPSRGTAGVMFFVKQGGDSKVGYCLDFGKALPMNTPLTALSDQQSEQLRAALEFGYRNPTESPTDAQKAQYGATQVTVWNIMEGVHGTAKARKAMEEYGNVLADRAEGLRFFDELNAKMRDCKKLPDFLAKDESQAETHTLHWNAASKRYEKYFTDANQAECSLSTAGSDSLKLECVDKAAKKYCLYTEEDLSGEEGLTVTRTDAGGGLRSCLIWGAADVSTQRVVTANPEAVKDYAKGFLKAKTEKGSILLRKVDAETGEPMSQIPDVTFAGTVYRLRSADGETVRDLVLDETGTCRVDGLDAGTYYIRETAPPTGYNPDPKEHEITLPGTEGEQPLTVEVTSREQVIRGRIEILKRGEGRALPGTEFTITNQKTGEAVTIVTDARGNAYADNLPFGTYRIEETKCPPGYIKGEPFEAEITEEGQCLSYTVENKGVKGKLILEKRDAETKRLLDGVEFVILAKEDILAGDGSILLKAGEVADRLVTKEGIAESKELYLGAYEVRETKTLPGYRLPDTSYEVTFTYQGEDIPVITERLSVENQKEIIRTQEVRTGDMSSAGMHMSAMAVAFLAVILISHRKTGKKRR